MRRQVNMGKMLPPAPLALPQRFSLIEEVGSGGMAVVYRGHDHHLDRPVAIKVLREELSSTLEVARFQREIGVTAKLVHPGIVALFDSGESDGRLYYVMPYVSGDTLRARLAREHRLAAKDAANIGADVAEALAYAHGAGIVHRDIKPENVFLVEQRAVLADFGIARAATQRGNADGRTVAGMVVGTVSYMSPEQIEGREDIDGRSDLYSLGCMLYELLTGTPPFVGGELVVLSRHLTAVPAPIAAGEMGVPPALEEIVLRLLAKDREDRFATAAEVAPLLRAASLPAPTEARAVAPPRRASNRPATEIDRLVDEATLKLNQATAVGPAAVRRFEEARALLDHAAVLDASHPRVLAALSRWHNGAAHRIGDPERMFAEGRRLALLALAADDRDPEVHAVLGKIALYRDDDFRVAEEHARRAVELAPDDPEALRFLAIIEKILGRLEDAIAASRHATRVAPQVAAVWNGLGDALLAAGRNAEAAEALKRAISIQPAYVPALERLELAELRLGDAEFAVDVRAARLRATGCESRADDLERNARADGAESARRADVGVELRDLLEQASRGDPFGERSGSRTLGDRVVFAYTELGDWDAALQWIERGYKSRPSRIRRALMDQLFDRHGFSTLPRYGRLLRLAGLEELL